MSDDAELRIGIEADDNATSDLRKIAGEVGSLGEKLAELSKLAASASRQSNSVEKALVGIGKGGKQAASGIDSSTQSMQEQARAAKTLSDNLLEVSRRNMGSGNIFATDTGGRTTGLNTGSGINYGAEQESLRKLSAEREQALALRAREQKSIRETVLANIAETRAWREGNDVRKQVSNSAQEVAGRMGLFNAALENSGRSSTMLRENLFQTRFALNDIAFSAGIAAAGLVGMNAVVVNAAATYETAMAAIRRTTGASATEINQIREDFIDLAQTIPGGFDQLAQIGELAGQLNVASDRIADFTSNVAKFTSATDVSVQASAEAFGRLDALLPDVKGNYEALGSSILNVGVNSVATESAIISTTTQIAAAGAAAGMTANEVIGLAASYASLGIAPEAARGSTIRVFAVIRKAVAEGGAALEEFGRISGMTGDQFAATFNRSGTEALNAFLTGLDNLTKSGQSAEMALRGLSITGVRDINALLRLSQNMDIVGNNFTYAAEGFNQATALGDAFAITSETLNAKLSVLGSSLEAFFATLGEGSTGPLKFFVESLINVLGLMTELMNNPVAQGIALFTGLFTVLAGGVLLITSLAARFGAMVVAVRQVRTELVALQVNATTAGTAMGALQGRVAGATIAMTSFSNIMKATGWGLAVSAAITAITLGIEAFNNASKSASDRAKELFGDLSGLTGALQTDTQEVAKGTQEALGTVNGTITQTIRKNSEWGESLQAIGFSQQAVGSTVDETTKKIDDQTFSIGKNAAAWWQNEIAGNEAIQGLFTKYQQLMANSEGRLPELDFGGVITAMVTNDTEEALRILNDWQTRANTVMEEDLFTNEYGDRLSKFFQEVQDITAEYTKQIEATGGAYEAAAQKAELLDLTAKALADGLGLVADEGDNTATSLDSVGQTLTQQIEAALGPLAVLADMTASTEQLFKGLASSGADAFDLMGQAGAANMDNLINALATVITAGAAMGVSTTESVAALFLSLQKMGIDTANLLAAVANIPGIDQSALNSYLDGTQQMSAGGQYLSSVLGAVQQSATKATTATASTGSAAKKAGEEMKKASVSAAQFADTLGQIVDRANDIRWGVEEARDATRSMLNGIAEEAANARAAIVDLNREIDALNGENQNLEYALQVAISFGDENRANEIRAQIAKNNADIADKQKDRRKEQGKLNKSTKGNTDSAIENRKALRDLAKSYQDQVEAYAATGASQKEVEAYARRLYKQYQDEAKQLGFNTTDVKNYGKAITDTATIIKKMPKDSVTTIKIDGLSAAEAALKEFNTKTKEAADKASSDIRTGGGKGYTPKIPKVTIPAPKIPLKPPSKDGVRRIGVGIGNNLTVGISDALRNNPKTFKLNSGAGKVSFKKNKDGTFSLADTSLGTIRFYKQGGYTGDGSKHAISGVTHGKEYVINEQNTSRLGTDFFDAINAGKTPVVPVAANRGNGIQVVELSAYDRALLAAVGNTTLEVSGQVLGKISNAANFQAGQRGSN